MVPKKRTPVATDCMDDALSPLALIVSTKLTPTSSSEKLSNKALAKETKNAPATVLTADAVTRYNAEVHKLATIIHDRLREPQMGTKSDTLAYKGFRNVGRKMNP
mmetsp:Transcript_14407/g.27219  ORF Transcript_14407/g.27219 Transcript_14407/m.27219 type:complete len:105 (-) Transcript_14407:207-521(-)